MYKFLLFSVLCTMAFGNMILGVDKSGYTLWRPVPTEQMREFSTDRPDQTESAYTVDAGHIQVEMDFVNHAREDSRASDTLTQGTLVGNVNLKFGLLNNVDMQWVFCPFATHRLYDRTAGTTTTASGLGEVLTRLKINMWGNDSGDTALAIMPYVKWPFSKTDLRNGKWECGLIVPYAVALNEKLNLGLMAQTDLVYDEGLGGTQFQYFTSATLGRSLTDKLGMYTELATRFIPEKPAQAQFDMGLTYALYDNVQLDVGGNVGLTSDADDLVVFAGISWRK